jgi:hypothetical protein
MTQRDDCHCDDVLVNDVGVWPVDAAAATARREPVPGAVRDDVLFCVEAFLRACQRLAERGGKDHFPLPVRTLARVLGVTDFDAWSLLNRLIRGGVLQQVAKGSPGRSGAGSGHASQYRFVGRGGLFDEAR